jgi:hypothetical protein
LKCIYADPLAGQTISVAAVVDTEAPAITGVVIEPDYTDATSAGPPPNPPMAS